MRRARPDSHGDDRLFDRMYSEFLEMPGLHLTCRQAQRLWHLDEETCRRLLDALVEARFLYRARNGAYARAADGPAVVPRPRMAKAETAPARQGRTRRAG